VTRLMHATRRPLPTPTPGGERVNPSMVTADTLPAHVRWALQRRRYRPLTCECGQPAVYLGLCDHLTPGDSPISGGMFLCAACAALCDAGVRLKPL
jgi:hypothetical protein